MISTGFGWIERRSSRGLPFEVWRPMPWIEPAYLECTVYLYPSEKEAEDGDHIGGSGFVVGIDLGGKGPRISRPHLLCVVTNKHIIKNGNMVVRVNTLDGKRDIVPLDGERWFTHPDGDDLAVCPIRMNPLHKAAYFYIPTNKFLTKSIIESYEIGPGDDVFIIGRFVNHEGKQRNLPSARFGNIAQMPWEPIVVDGTPQESFLVEARSISGYSGSPVFVYCPPQNQVNLNPKLKELNIKLPGVSQKRRDIPIMLGPWLLGVNYCHIRWDEPIWSRLTKKPVSDDWFIKSNTGMMGVVPAWRLMEIIEGAEMKPLIDAAKRKFEETAKGDSSVELDVAKPQPSLHANADNPTHREDFTRLVGEAARKRERED